MTDPQNNPIPPTPEPGSEPPEWATNLLNEMRALPGKLKATVTDEDGDRIASRVHGLFEKSGAFEAPKDEPAKDEPTEDPIDDPDNPPPPPSADKQPSKGDSVARRWFGRY